MMHMRPRDVLALCFSAFALGGCPTPAASDPPAVNFDASDAAALVDGGADTCARLCAAWARANCREATPDCYAVCVTGSARGFYSPRMIACVLDAGAVDASSAHASMQRCDDGMCP